MYKNIPINKECQHDFDGIFLEKQEGEAVKRGRSKVANRVEIFKILIFFHLTFFII